MKIMTLVLNLMILIALKVIHSIAEESVPAKYGEFCDPNKIDCEVSNVMTEYKCIDNTCSCPLHPEAMKGLTYQDLEGDDKGCFIVVGFQCNGEDATDGTCVKNAICKNGICVCKPGATCVSKVTKPPAHAPPKVEAAVGRAAKSEDAEEEEEEEDFGIMVMGSNDTDTSDTGQFNYDGIPVSGTDDHTSHHRQSTSYFIYTIIIAFIVKILIIFYRM